MLTAWYIRRAARPIVSLCRCFVGRPGPAPRRVLSTNPSFEGPPPPPRALPDVSKGGASTPLTGPPTSPLMGELGRVSMVRLEELDKALRARGFNTLQVLGGVVFVVAAVIYGLRESLRDNLSGEVAQVAGRAITDETVVSKAEEFSRSILHQILNDPSLIEKASGFVVQVIKRPETLEAIVTLLHDLTRDEQTRESLGQLLSQLLMRDETRTALLEMLRVLGDQEGFRQFTSQLTADIVASQIVRARATELGLSVVHNVMEDEKVRQHLKDLFATVLQDKALHVRGGEALRGAIRHSLWPFGRKSEEAESEEEVDIKSGEEVGEVEEEEKKEKKRGDLEDVVLLEEDDDGTVVLVVVEGEKADVEDMLRTKVAKDEAGVDDEYEYEEVDEDEEEDDDYEYEYV